MGITAGAVHRPDMRLADKELTRAHRRQGLTELALPGWDEDPLTMAIEAALHLGDRVEVAQRIHLALDEAHDQPGLALIALGLEAELVEHAGPEAGLEALASADPSRPSLVLAGGSRLGGAGAALLLEPEAGIPVEASATCTGGSLSGQRLGPLTAALETLDGRGPLVLPAGRLGRKQQAPAERVHTELTRQVGDAGAAAALVELCSEIEASAGPRQVASVSDGRAVAVQLGQGQVPFQGLEARGKATTWAAYQAMRDHAPVAWHEASQGAYVSAETYEADPVQRYGARTTGPGTVATVTTIQAGPPGEFQAQHAASGPYDVAIVELAAGGRTIGQVAGPPGQLAIGQAVEPVLRRLFRQEGRWRYAIKWRPSV